MSRLGPEMQAEGWIDIAADCGSDEHIHFVWLHPPSRQCIRVWELPRKTWIGPVWGPEPADPLTVGYLVGSYTGDEDGNPDPDGRGGSAWVASLGLALKLARQMRASILDGRYRPPAEIQLTFDDAIDSAAVRGGGR